MTKAKNIKKDRTADKILQAACKVFPEHGFAGTSISMLAKEAQINQSLIYHHFGNKEELWKAAKAYLLRDVFAQVIAVNDMTSLEDFVKHAVRTRFEWYLRHPEIIRMLSWQRLEPKRKQLQGTASIVDHWSRVIPRLQRDGKVRSDLSVEMIIILMTNLIISPLLDDSSFLHSKETCEQYLQTIIDAIIFVLKPR